MNTQKATFGGGCFWCIEALMQRLNGVEAVVSGYAGGSTNKPDYRSVCSGSTGHAEVVQVSFDADIISYEDLLTIFINSHNPTTLNSQGADKGTQYRSVIFYHDNDQKEIAEKVVNDLNPLYDNKIVTEISELKDFHQAEEYHQNYYNRNNYAGYCTAVIDPKINKIRAKYADRLKDESMV